MHVLSIDIGILHLGLVYATVNDNFTKILEINTCKRVDIKYLCEFCKESSCSLHHDLCISDYVKHLFQKYHSAFKEADYILIEQQPPMGLIAVQEIIVYEYRNKIQMVSPCAMHKYFDIHSYDYDKRKEFVVQYAKNYLSKCFDFKYYDRKHDMADAFCLLVFWMNTEHEKQKETLKVQTYQKDQKDFLETLETFTYREG